MAFVHELGHNFGAYHASCVNDIPRGSFAWCDFPSTDKRASMCAQTPSYTDYCSPFNVMGAAPKVFGQSSDWRQKRSFGMDAKVVFNWVDPALVTTIDWDPITSSYTTCTPNCSFLLQPVRRDRTQRLLLGGDFSPSTAPEPRREPRNQVLCHGAPV